MKIEFLPDTDLNLGLKCHEKYNNNWSLAIDVGANNGHYSKMYCSRFANVIGFEPNRSLEQCLVELANTVTNYQFYALGLYDTNDEVNYYSVTENTALSGVDLDYIIAVTRKINSSFAVNKQVNSQQIEKYTISTRTLDSLNLKPDFIKIDVEGVGLHVLKGAYDTIMQSKPTIQIEKGNEMEWLQSIGYVKLNEDSLVDGFISDNIYMHQSKIGNH